jgi:hypothetical protein
MPMDLRNRVSLLNDSSNLFQCCSFVLPGSSSRKLAKTLEAEELAEGLLAISPRSKTSSTSQSFIREEAPHTTRIPAPLWNKRRPVERLSRWSSDRHLESEESFRDRGRETDGVTERYSRERTARWSSDRHRESEESFRDRGRVHDGVSEQYSQEQTFGGGHAGKKVAESIDTRYYANKQYLERRESRLPGKFSVSYYKIA